MITFEYWHLLAIPLFFVLGWGAARIDIRHLVKESRALPRSYFQGLNFLLNEEPDRAIEAFMVAVKLDPHTIELHFALGSLFRRRGEIERAIKMHQSLLDREEISQDFRLDALEELGEDYFKAGLLDRAEEIFERLLKSDRKEAAQKKLLDIYQLEKSWEKAIEMAEALPGASRQIDIAEYYCELAHAEIIRSHPEKAQHYLSLALQKNRKCVRAHLLEGELFLLSKNHEAAIAAWQKIEHQDPAYLSFAARRLVSAYQEIGKKEAGLQLLRGYLSHYPSSDLLDVVFSEVLSEEGAEAAYALVRDELKRHPTLLGFDKLIEARLMFASPEARPDLDLAKNIVQNYIKRLARYCCADCGFKARQFYWRCPACGGWETYSPKRTEEFDQIL